MGSAEIGDFVKKSCVIPFQIGGFAPLRQTGLFVIEYGAKGMSGLFKNRDHKKIYYIKKGLKDNPLIYIIK